jgi:hypothetical protein
MAKFGMRKRPKINDVQIDEPDVFELLIKHINGEQENENILNLSYEFYGANGNCFKLGYNGQTIIIEAIENPDDGYRSSFDSLCRFDSRPLRFSRDPLAIVNVRKIADNDEDFDGWTLVSVYSDHTWLRFGTDYYDDYYPCFKFEYFHKEKEVLDLDSKEVYINYVRGLLEEMKKSIEFGIAELETLKNRYSRASAESIAKFFRENGLNNFAVEVEEIIEIAEDE